MTGSFGSSSAETFVITDEGMMKFPIAVSGSTSVTASIGVRHQSGSGSPGWDNKPAFILKYSEQQASASVSSHFLDTYETGSDLYIQVVTSSIHDRAWETLRVSGSFVSSSLLELVCYNRQSGSDSKTNWSDLEIT